MVHENDWLDEFALSLSFAGCNRWNSAKKNIWISKGKLLLAHTEQTFSREKEETTHIATKCEKTGANSKLWKTPRVSKFMFMKINFSSFSSRNDGNSPESTWHRPMFPTLKYWNLYRKSHTHAIALLCRFFMSAVWKSAGRRERKMKNTLDSCR